MNAQPSIIQVPLSQLRLSPRNARKTGGQDIEGLAASIAAHNLLQNLTVTPGANDDAYEVVAGGRRLAAMQLLRDRGQLDAEFSVPCKLIADDDVALEASTAENTLREAMHPADQFDAFKGMVDNGKSIDDVAAHFGVAPIVVRQRLKLANLNPKFLAMYREDGISLEQLHALAITDDHEAQRQAWFGVKNDWERHPSEIRDRLTKRDVSSDDIVAKFVGLDAYEAAGGRLTRDLFSNRAYLADKALLDSLAMDKLEALAAEERKLGWAWVEVHLSLDYNQVHEYAHSGIEPKYEKPTADQGERIKAINARLAEIDAVEQDEAAYEALSDHDLDAMNDEYADLIGEREKLSKGKETWPADGMAKTGVVIYLDQHQGLRYARGRLQPGQKIDKAGDITGTAKPSSAAKPADKPKKAALTDAMVRRLSQHRTLALQETLAGRPDVALPLLVTHLLARLVTHSTGTCVEISGQSVFAKMDLAIRSGQKDIGAAPAYKAIAARIKAWQGKGLPKSGGTRSLAAWVADRSQAEQLELLALATALTVDAQHGANGRVPEADALAELLDLDMAVWWQPTADTYLSLVPKSLALEAVAEVAGKPAAKALETLKKDAAAAQAGKHLAGTGWLPKPLRGPKYAVAAKAGKAETKKAAAKKKPAKKKTKAD